VVIPPLLGLKLRVTWRKFKRRFYAPRASFLVDGMLSATQACHLGCTQDVATLWAVISERESCEILRLE
jgi:hypothetical protein